MPWKIVRYEAILAVEPWRAYTLCIYTCSQTHIHTRYLSLIHPLTPAQARRAQCDKHGASTAWWITLILRLTCIQAQSFHPNMPLKLSKLNTQQWTTVQGWGWWKKVGQRESRGWRGWWNTIYLNVSVIDGYGTRFFLLLLSQQARLESETTLTFGLYLNTGKSKTFFFWASVLCGVDYVWFIVCLFMCMCNRPVNNRVAAWFIATAVT